MNAHCERFNRTIQENFVDYHEDLLFTDLDGFNQKLADWLVRQYFPKSYDLSAIKISQLAHVVDQINNRPRKCLGMKTPNQALFGINSLLHFGVEFKKSSTNL